MNALSQTVENILNQNQMISKTSPSEYRCPVCKVVIPPIEINVLGRIRTVQPVCKCESERERRFLEAAARLKEKRETEKLFSISDLGKRFEESKFDNVLPRPGIENVIKISQQYIREFEKWGTQSLLIWGDPGNGKTHIASAIANTLHDQGYIVVFQSVPELLERIRSTFNKNSRDSEDQIMKALLTCDLLVLDDIGAEKLTDWVQDVIFRIVDGRYRKELPILYTSNLALKELAGQVSNRTYDRITETSVIVQNKALSYRKEIAKRRLEQFRN